MKPTEAQIEEQLEWERHAKAQGLSRLHQQTAKLEAQDYASASVYGIASIDCIMPRVMAEIERTTRRIHEGHSGVAFKEIQEYLADVESMACAAIALKVIFDKVFSIKDDANTNAKICEAIGTAVEQECQMRWYEREVPGLLHKLKEIYWHESKGTPQKFSVMRLMMNRQGIVWRKWAPDVRTRLGGWLLDCVCNVSGWFEPLLYREGKKTHKLIVPSAAFMDAKDQIMANAEMFAPLAWPMLVPPRNWSNEKAGGYYLNEIMLGHDMVRRSECPPIQGETPIEFLNKIQGVAYRLNPFVVEVAETLFKQGIAVGKFIPIVEMDMPPKPVDIADNKDARQGYKRAAAHVMDLNAQAFKKSCRTRMTMDAVSKYKDRERFYLPWSFDYRGRAYPIPAFLTPQDTDFGKSLLQFADAAFITNDCVEWIKFQVATTFGLDKAPITERLDWVDNNESLITRVATDPIGNIGDWEGVEEPWLFLAACEEYYYTCIVCTRQSTRLPIAVDATCSGVQILAGLARDASAARLVNVLPGDRPQDAYREVAEAAMPNIPERLQPHTDRKVTKRTVMTLPYNSKPHSNRKYIREAYDEKDECDPPITKEELTQVVSAVRDAMREVLPGVMDVMEWIEREVGIIIRGGADHLEWVTPSGFVVYQKLNKKHVESLRLQLLGKISKVSVATGDTDEVNLQKHKNTTSPNLIHSLDASLLHLATLKFDAPIALIHDSVLCRATDMGCLSYLIRETYMYMFAEHDYLRDWAKQVGATTEPPIIDTLEPESVIESTYFFC
jgi:DNA-directed RNA polymerase